MIEDRSRDYMNARRVAKVGHLGGKKIHLTNCFLQCQDGLAESAVARCAQEYETVMKGLDRNAPSVPPQNSPQEAQQVDMWKKYIQWEKSNPLRTEDQTLITKRGDSLSMTC